MWENKLLQSKAVESAQPTVGSADRLYAAYKSQQAGQLQKKEPAQIQPQPAATAQVRQPQEIKPTLVQAQPQVQIQQQPGAYF